MLSNKQKKILYKPVFYGELYLIFIAFLFWGGPIKWEQHNSIYFTVLLFSYYYFFYKGYSIAIKTQSVSKCSYSDKKVIRFLDNIIFINFIIVVILTVRSVGLQSFSISAISNSLIQGFADSGHAYKDNLERSGELYGGSLFSHLYVFFAPLLYPIIPLSFFYFKKIKFANRVVVIITIIFEIARWVAVGTNKGIFDLFILFVSIAFMKNSIKQYENNLFSVNKKSSKKVFQLVFVILLLVACISYFNNNISSRFGNIENADLENIVSLGNDGGTYNSNSIISILSPPEFLPAFIFLDSYLTQGYYATSLAITESFTPMFGFGHSMFLIDNFNPIFQTDLLNNSYQAKLEKYGIDRFVNWHSFYTWIANDVSFLGVILIMFALGYYLALIYKDILQTRNPISMALFCLLTQLIFYIPANNQIFAQPVSFVAFTILSIFWFFRKYKLKIGSFSIV